MDDNNYALFIGIKQYEDKSFLPNLRYAEKDCMDLYEVLTSNWGFLPPENAQLLLGKDASTRRVEEALHSVVSGRSGDESVIVYFSGHGFVLGEYEYQEAYLGTTDVRANALVTNPNAGLRMKFIHEDIFMRSKARHLIFILDCCYSGALVPSAMRAISERSPAARRLIDETFYETGKGRVALFACPPDAVSRESADLENGIFTHFLARGLRGEAVEADTGDVTIDSLMAYVRVQTPPEQPPGRYGQDFGRLVLTRPTPKISRRRPPEITSSKTLPAQPLRNPLEPYQDFINRLIGDITTASVSGSDIASRILESVRRAAQAQQVFVASRHGEDWTIKAHNDLQSPLKETAHIELAVPQALSAIPGEPRTGAYFFASREQRGTIACIPLATQTAPATDLMIIAGLSSRSPLLGEPFATIIRSLYASTGGLTSAQPDRIEAVILDELKRTYGVVPLNIYERRFELFVSRLKGMIVYFEPILLLDPKFLGFSSWEALARDPEQQRAPVDLFDAAELWGRRFTIELDIHFLLTAADLYRKSYEAKLSQREDLRELSVNVYPESLLRTAYKNAVRSVMREVLPPNKLVLEISEKAPMPLSDSDGLSRMTEDTFKSHLAEYLDWQVRFAIDDFGVGHSSVSRLARLDPEHIKIDRDALLHRYGSTIIEFVKTLATQNRMAPPKIVVEGVDQSSLLSLEALYKIGVRYVQGHLIGMAAPDLYMLDEELKENLRSLILGR